MNEQIKDKIRSIYEKEIETVLRVYDIFKDFYGEDKVDLQNDDFSSIEIKIECQNIFNWKSSFFYKDEITKSDCFSNEKKEELYNLIDEAKNGEKRVTVGSLIEDEEVFLFFVKYLIEYVVCNSIFNILIYFGDVRVTNEFDKYIDISGLWVKVDIYSNGKFAKFKLNRSKYDITQFRSGYMHSHVSSIPTYNFEEFQVVCTGNGPINNTISTLRNNFNESMWQLFCLELNLFTKVESIGGIPYHRLENVGNVGVRENIASEYTMNNLTYLSISPTTLDDIDVDTSHTYLEEFCIYLFKKNVLSFSFAKGSYSLGLSFKDALLLITDVFIEWYNKILLDYSKIDISGRINVKELFVEVFFQNNKLYLINSRSANTEQSDREYCLQYVGSKICTFKGKNILLEIEGATEVPQENRIKIINPKIVENIIAAILLMLNNQYGKDNGEESSTQIRTQRRYI